MTLPNHFMRSATCELFSESDGFPTEEHKKTIKKLAKGKTGLIIPGYVYVNKNGKGLPGQCGFDSLEKAKSWKSTVDEVHKEGSKIMFQIAHCGIASLTSEKRTPSRIFPFSKSYTIAEIEDLIEDFRKASVYAESIGADGVQIHAAHGYLLSLFLSPLTNRRNDKYGGSPERRIRIIQEIVDSIRASTSPEFAIGIKMNGTDNLGLLGVRPKLCSKYVSMLKGIDLFEISCGLGNFMTSISFQTVGFPAVLCNFFNPWAFREDFNQESAEYIKKQNPDKIIASVGGHRNFALMEKAVKEKRYDIVSMSRPFIRQPNLVKMYMEGKIKRVDCLSCNKCIFEQYFSKNSNGPFLRCKYP
ncbi:oxidoreductase, FAD/FMN-binding family protein [Histomonas meleagridis]|uniref:oxidoreductase, FAD/FMN-binding family protein n=1 Tax=Histomonas meleagridis TaxID=135588 RepID=UPI003559F64B|nr:oxidoreductase, FAD/FMN-binding family protein [Histomonas meleagridis]KAH0796114.1 oxidoreductase, FAD/FMN-binding family protein [Histomonas meleagridis]